MRAFKPHIFSVGEKQPIIFVFELALALLNLELGTVKININMRPSKRYSSMVFIGTKCFKKIKSCLCSNIQPKTYVDFLMNVVNGMCCFFTGKRFLKIEDQSLFILASEL